MELKGSKRISKGKEASYLLISDVKTRQGFISFWS